MENTNIRFFKFKKTFLKITMNNIIILPILIFIISTALFYIISNDPDKKKKPINFLIPGVFISVCTFGILKYRETHSEPLMQGNYFD